jgi:hypothetical protein
LLHEAVPGDEKRYDDNQAEYYDANLSSEEPSSRNNILWPLLRRLLRRLWRGCGLHKLDIGVHGRRVEVSHMTPAHWAFRLFVIHFVAVQVKVKVAAALDVIEQRALGVGSL